MPPNVRGNLVQMDKGLSALCHWLSQSLNVLPPALAISTGTFKWLRFRGDQAPNWWETHERWFKILAVMKLTVGGSALNVMREIRGRNRSQTYIYRGHGGKWNAELKSTIRLLFTSCQVNINRGELWVSDEDDIINVFVCFAAARVYCEAAFSSPLTALFPRVRPPHSGLPRDRTITHSSCLIRNFF